MISIYKENPKYSLALRKDGDAAVVVIVDSRGDLVDSPYLLRIGHTGLLRYSGANCEALEYLGIPTDAVDSIKISPDIRRRNVLSFLTSSFNSSTKDGLP